MNGCDVADCRLRLNYVCASNCITQAQLESFANTAISLNIFLFLMRLLYQYARRVFFYIMHLFIQHLTSLEVERSKGPKRI